MDYDSSSKFISSLAKFLQSLCNGYVEFDNGVEVIGHIYLSVDTGKKIDYILNEKVCKTDENSVTFISNSFHAQPAEKPKPNSKKGRCVDQTEPVIESVEIDESNSSVEPRSTNLGTVLRNPNRNSQTSSPGPRKRPFSPHSKGGSSASKKGRNESSQEQLSFGMVSDEVNISFPAASSDPLRGHPHQSSPNFPPQSNSSQSYDPGYQHAAHNSIVGNSEDIKPSMDTDVTFVKEEFGGSEAEEEKSQGLDGSYSSMHSANQQYSEGPSSQSYGQQNSRLSFGGERSDNGIFDTSISQLEGSEIGAGDPSVPSQANDSKPPIRRAGLQNCHSTGIKTYPVGECGFCPEDFYDLKAFLGHIDLVDTTMSACQSETQIKLFQCGSCQLSLSNLRRMRDHLRLFHHYTHHQNIGVSLENNKQALQCHHCNKSYSDKKGLKRHLAALEGVYFQCSFCEKQFARQDTLSSHIKRIHDLHPK